MSLLFRIVYAGHARGTHHKLALDALRGLNVKQAENWRRLFLKHAEMYISGSKAPDDEFKDFINHVLHVGDDYWGGAPDKTENWYAHFVQALKDKSWEEAVWCAGVLSHYYTDPIMPFHTAQSEAENNIHRAAEWSINRSYDELRARGLKEYGEIDVPVPQGDGWLKEMVCQGAERSHRGYERLIAHYDIHKGVVDPAEGLDDTARELVADLLIYGANGFSRILERAIAEAGVEPPKVSLTLATVVGAIKIPIKRLLKKLEDNDDKRQVQAMYDELVATGTVEKHLPEDDRAVRAAHASEVMAKKFAAAEAARAERIKAQAREDMRAKAKAEATARAKAQAQARVEAQAKERAAAQEKARAEAAARAKERAEARAAERAQAKAGEAMEALAKHEKREPLESRLQTTTLSGTAAAVAGAAAMATSTSADGLSSLEDAQAQQRTLSSVPIISRSRSEPSQEPAAQCENSNPRDRSNRVRLAMGDALEAAPSIGPKTEARLNAVGLLVVRDLMNAEPEDLAARLGVRHINAQTIRDWQDQAGLVMSLPGLNGTHAQLLVGAGMRDIASIANADPGVLSASVLKFATTREGERLLRSGNPPDIEKIKAWIEGAAQAQAA